MSVITSVGTAVPGHRVGQDVAQRLCRALFRDAFADIDRLLPVFDNALIGNRYFSAPLEWFESEHSLAEKNRLYIETALEVGNAAISTCLERAGLGPEDIDHLFFVSTTGLATPSMDARLINILRLRPDIRRTPIWGLGCAGGVAGLSRAYEYTQAFPRERALVLALELCGLTFQRNDLSKSNLVATSLFADGAAAVLVSGSETAGVGPRILSSRSTLWYDSLDVMGWDVNDQGLKVLFSRDIPAIVRSLVLPAITAFLATRGIAVHELRHIVAHPGGAKVIEAYEQILGLENGRMKRARDVLSRYGNMSSPTVLFVLEDFLQAGAIHPGEYGLVTALGPGFSSEMILIQG
ncbi:MAG: type III polyketide synthase [Acidobacteriia bacterium]|nr:type III polyketide synthase [Terriglobia bacterium]